MSSISDEEEVSLPNKPLLLLASTSNGSNKLANFNLSFLTTKFQQTEEKLSNAQQKCRAIERCISSVRASLELNTDCKIEEEELKSILNSTNEELLLSSDLEIPRESRLNIKFEEVIRLLSLLHFLRTGKLIELEKCNAFSNVTFHDEEYLIGIISFITIDLSRYGLGQAISQDLDSIVLVRDLVDQVLECLLEFDFRNGILRRKYDGVKYVLNMMENIQYELGMASSIVVVTSGSPDAKRVKKEDKKRVNYEEFRSIQQRYQHRDEQREKVIKKCRDIQKYAKQAIYALHRNDEKRSSNLISSCESISKELYSRIVQQEPMLRYGSYANFMEEYAEAKLFEHWLTHKELLLFQDMPFEDEMNEEEYLGGLFDLTGEINRFAVKKGTERNLEMVQFCLVTNLCIWNEILKLGNVPGRVHKKMETLMQTIKKMEYNLYELNLLLKSNKRNGAATVGAGSAVEEMMQKITEYEDHDADRNN